MPHAECHAPLYNAFVVFVKSNNEFMMRLVLCNNYIIQCSSFT